MRSQESQQNNLVIEKEQKYVETRHKVEAITDKLGEGVDEGIKETVTALLANGLSTSQSCEGHIGGRGEGYPWVEICVPEPNGWEEDEKKQEEWKTENLKQQKRVVDIFSEFYRERNTPFDARLNFRYIGAFGEFRIQSIGSETIVLVSPDEQKQKLEEYRKEMADFTEFLKNRFLEK